MDKILVTLLLVIVSIAALVGLEKWTSDQRSNLINSSNDKVNIVMQENN